MRKVMYMRCYEKESVTVDRVGMNSILSEEPL